MPKFPAGPTSIVPTPEQNAQAVKHHGHLLAWRSDGRQWRTDLLTQLAHLADDQGIIPFSQTQLLEHLPGISRRTLENTLSGLVKAGALLSRGKGRYGSGYQFLPEWFQVPASPAPQTAHPIPIQPRPIRPVQKPKSTRPSLPPWQVAINDLRTEFQNEFRQLRLDLGLSPAPEAPDLPPVQTITPTAAPPPEPEITALRSELKEGFLSLEKLLSAFLPSTKLSAVPAGHRDHQAQQPLIPPTTPLPAAASDVEPVGHVTPSIESKTPNAQEPLIEKPIDQLPDQHIEPSIDQPTPTTQPTPLPPATRLHPGRPPSTGPNKIEARADTLFKHLLPIAEHFCDLTPLDLDTVIEDLAQQELDWQTANYPQDDGSPNWNTILKTNLRIFKKRLKLQVASFLASHIDSPIGQLADLWCNAYDTLVRPHTWELNTDYRENAHDQALSPTPVNLSPLLRQAFQTLQKVADGSLTVPWQAVSSAMALATGRRQAEIHSTATFKPSGEYAVLFCPRGDRPFAQTKTRPGSEAHKEWLQDPIRSIPTLLPAHLVLAGDAFLEKGYKVHHEDQVNKNFNAKLRSHMASLAPGFQYKNLRDFYAVACLRNWLHDGLPEGSLNIRIKEVLGHGPLGDATPSYMKFQLSPDSLSRI